MVKGKPLPPDNRESITIGAGICALAVLWYLVCKLIHQKLTHLKLF